MRRRIILPIALSVLVLVVVAGSVLPQARVVVREQITITVDRAQVHTDVPPISVQGRTLVPVRNVFDAFDAEVQWFPRERRVYIRQDTKVIWLRIGENRAQVNDEIVPLEVPAMLYRGRTMVPLRFIAESLGATVEWNADTQTITITQQTTAVPQQ